MVARGRLRQWQTFRADMESAPTVSPWPPLRGGSARRRWGRELYGCPKYFGLWQCSLPPPLRGTALAEGGQRVKKHRLCYIENVGATIGRPPAWRSNALSGMAFLQGIRARASNARPYRSFSTVCPKGYRAVFSHYYYDAIRLILQ